MNRCTAIQRRSEGKRWHITGPETNGWIPIRTINNGKEHARYIKAEAYRDPARWPTIPTYNEARS